MENTVVLMDTAVVLMDTAATKSELLAVPELCYFIQARMSSTRLPGKMLMFLGRLTVLENVLFGLPRAQTVVLTSTEKSDDAIFDLCCEKSIHCFRGSERNVFARFLAAMEAYPARFYARLTGDNPMVVKTAAPKMIEYLKSNSLDYVVSSGIYLGGALEMFTRESFLIQAKKELSLAQKEHVTPAYYAPDSQWHYNRFDLGCSELSSLRLTIDEQADFDLMSDICQRLSKNACDISVNELWNLYQKEAAMFSKNQHISQLGLQVQKE